jgi:hypothetical protein
MTPQNLISTVKKWALGLLFILTITALAQTVAAQETHKLSVSGPIVAAPTQITTCPTIVLPGGGGNSANERAPNTNFRWGRAHYLITAAELAANGYAPGTSPTTIGWSYNVGNTAGASAPLIIYMENTADTTNLKSTTWATAITGMTTVHNAVTALPSAAGSFDITLTGGSPFTYTGGGLYIAFDWGQYTGTLSTTANIDCNVSLVNGLKGGQSSTAAPTTVAASNFRPATRLSSTTQNDASVDGIYSFGELPLGQVPAQVTRAEIVNKGVAPATNVMATLNVTGADTFTDMQTIASLASCSGSALATFGAFTPGALGLDTVTVSLPPDDFAPNNSLSKPLMITSRDYSYKHPGTTASGGVGFTGATGAIVCKFPITTANAVTAVKLEFNTVSATTYRVAIYGDSGTGTPSTTPLYVDAADRTVTVAGPVTITLPSPVAVAAGNFYAGVHQTNTTNGSLSFDSEAPLRTGSFFEDSPLPVASWADLAPAGTFKTNIGVILQNGVPAPTTAVSRKLHAGAPFDIDLLAANPIECRSGGATNDYQMVLTFPGAVTFSSATISAGTGAVQSSSGSGTTTVTVNLTGVTNIQRITVKLAALTETGNPANTGDLGLTMGVLVGDTNGNGAVNAGDTTQTRSRSGQTTDATNFRSDVNTDGTINSGDQIAVRSRSGTALP